MEYRKMGMEYKSSDYMQINRIWTFKDDHFSEKCLN